LVAADAKEYNKPLHIPTNPQRVFLSSASQRKYTMHQQQHIADTEDIIFRNKQQAPRSSSELTAEPQLDNTAADATPKYPTLSAHDGH
jgi:hypothetical protein